KYKESQPGEPKIATVIPQEGWINAITALAIKGDGFAHRGKSVVKQVIVGGTKCDFVVAGKKSIVALVPAGAFEGDTGKREVTVVTTVDTVTKNDAVEFTRTRTYPVSSSPKITLTRDAKGFVESIIVVGEGGATSRELLAAIRSILENERCCENVDISFSASGSAKTGPK
ncbi:MAG: IPT/TIG domain-containing protein, partial [Planctomycetota bacterium]|nr:IPT/TIG domain-containing protein [Planctomycetota bacterium]